MTLYEPRFETEAFDQHTVGSNKVSFLNMWKQISFAGAYQKAEEIQKVETRIVSLD